MDLCFATLALGAEYREHAKNLAHDLYIYANGIRFIVLTDKPSDFISCNNVDAFHHKMSGNWYCYHDKRYVFQKCFKQYKTVILLDSDCRLIDTPPFMEYISFKPGIRGLGPIKIVAHLAE